MKFTIPGEPTGKARPVVTKFGAHTPEKTVLYENLVKTLYPGGFFHEYLEVEIYAYFKIPKSAPKKKRELMLQGYILPDKKPDCDNIAKIILDALNGIAYSDDKQVVKMSVMKMYSEEPRAEVVLRDYKGKSLRAE